jgi:hypothetical protein
MVKHAPRQHRAYEEAGGWNWWQREQAEIEVIARIPAPAFERR